MLTMPRLPTTRARTRRPPPGFSGPRAVRAQELPALIRLLDSVFRTQGGSVAREHPYMYHPANARCLRVVLRNGVPVSHFGLRLWEVSVLGVTLKVASVGGVCTHPNFRGHGLATLLLRDAEQLCRRSGVDVVLVSGDRGLYLRNGCAPAVRCWHFRLTPFGTARLRDPTLRIRPVTANQLPLLRTIYECEPVRWVRPLDEFNALIRGRLARPLPDRFWVVFREAIPVAWFDLAQGNPEVPPTLWEYAGDRAAVLGGLALCMRELRCSAVTVPILWHDTAMIALLRAAKSTAAVQNLPGHTVKILDFSGLLAKLRPVLAGRIGTATLNAVRFESVGTGGRLYSNSGAWLLPDAPAIAQLVFGTAARDRLPVPSSAGPAIREFVRRAFPIPFVWPGINYV